jgi:hypothetical protein
MTLINTVMFKSNNHRKCYYNNDDVKCCVIPNGVKTHLFNSKKLLLEILSDFHLPVITTEI